MTRNPALPGLIAFGLLLGLPVAAQTKTAGGTKPVTTGAAIRGITLPGAGTSGTKAPFDCTNFQAEHVDGTGNMTDASVQCLPGGTVKTTLVGLPRRFNAYCVLSDLRRLGAARLIQAPINNDNDNHCSLSAMKPADAQRLFGGATWR